ncbi:MAG: permease-like cell division protein FtsX [Lachnospiraceae bacterium]
MAKINAFIYSFKQGINNIWRNKIFSMASIATMAACIFLFGLFFAIVENFQTMVKEAESGVAVTVFFEKKLPQEKIDEIGNKIKKRVEVSKIVYVSPEEAWEEYKEVYFKSKEALAEGFTEDNPLANAANYQIYLNDVSMQESLVTYLESMEGVRQVNKSEAVANTLSDFNRLIGYISAGIIIILLFVAIFLISNTITVGIGVRREEIAIMKLIGATDYFVRAPFVVEGIVIGLLGSVIPLILLYSMYGNIIAYIGENFSFLTKILNFLPAAEVFKTLTPVALLLGVGIGFLGSRLTIRKHLKV